MITQLYGTNSVRENAAAQSGASAYALSAISNNLVGATNGANGLSPVSGVASVEVAGGVSGYLGRSVARGEEAVGQSTFTVVDGSTTVTDGGQYSGNWAQLGGQASSFDMSNIFSSYMSTYGNGLNLSGDYQAVYGSATGTGGSNNIGVTIPDTWTTGALNADIPSSYSDNQVGASIPESYMNGTVGASIPESYTNGTVGASIPESYTNGTVGASIPESYLGGNPGGAIPGSYLTGNTGGTIPSSYLNGNTGAAIPNYGAPFFPGYGNGGSIPSSYLAGNIGESIPGSYGVIDSVATMPSFFNDPANYQAATVTGTVM